jgi:hypothetical protein
MKISCDTIEDLLPLYIEKLTSKDTNELIQEHITKCSRCYDTFSFLNTDLQVKSSDLRRNNKSSSRFFRRIRNKIAVFTAIILIFMSVVIYTQHRRYDQLTDVMYKVTMQQLSMNGHFIRPEQKSLFRVIESISAVYLVRGHGSNILQGSKIEAIGNSNWDRILQTLWHVYDIQDELTQEDIDYLNRQGDIFDEIRGLAGKTGFNYNKFPQKEASELIKELDKNAGEYARLKNLP